MRDRIRAVIFSLAMLAAAVPSGASAADGSFWQCATFARMFSGVQLFGNAAGWWRQATGLYDRGAAPRLGAVMVFKAISSMRAGHVATVSEVVSDRIVKVTHANWSVRGRVEHDVEVMDTSARNDWSSVRVWFKGLHDLGQRSYPVYGFIYGGGGARAKAAAPVRVAMLPAASARTPAPIVSARPAPVVMPTRLAPPAASAPIVTLAPPAPRVGPAPAIALDDDKDSAAA